VLLRRGDANRNAGLGDSDPASAKETSVRDVGMNIVMLLLLLLGGGAGADAAAREQRQDEYTCPEQVDSGRHNDD